MANNIRSAKPGNEWTTNDLDAYKIRITFQDAQMFFDETALPAPSVHQEILTAPIADDAVDDSSYNLLAQLELAMVPSEPEDSAVVDFTVAFFHCLGYIHRPRAIRTRKELRFLICGETKCAKPDICILNRDTNDIILLVQEDKRFGPGDVHAQLIAGTIAAFQFNNARRRAVGLDPLDSKVIPGIIMVGTHPSFFKIPVTQELTRCVESGQFPPAPTIVPGHVPDLPRPNHRFSEGMKPLDNRRAILQCYEAFKKFVL
ncbi:uncharacterized protein EV420DRAFT_1062917 [Desarmillaria tabescens]|uniref:Uncharacterized protein n=1 Tax=Armillaria tabescens TaxID=1929756 RepID=A0AA39NFZ4_ARMTA|nr:uncharacterized protein EV420DRAFT_1062917 [Desarmillaria tabescens]KAK0464768.1 hypothetical protein EV420DRAFT_1062917 [Desarmillaria tabescens]